MLQWMGGSRRKVTTSRKSTQKRQMQYFEQRKRQQQQIGELENYSDKKVTCNLHQENYRSLDILSLLNLSANGQECNSSCPNARGNSKGEFMTSKYQSEQSRTTIQMETTKVYPVEPIEFREARTLSNHQEETVCPKDQIEALARNNDKVDKLKMATDRRLSLVDLLGDDGQNSNLGGSLVHEPHVAFSIEGLGNVEMETPVHSPQQPARTFSYGCSSPFKLSKKVHSFKNLNCRLDDLEPAVDDMIRDVHMPYDASSLELPLYPIDTMEPFGNSKQKITSSKQFLQLNNNTNDLKDFFRNEEIFYDGDDQDEYKRNANSSFLDDNFFDEECGLSWKNWPCDFDSSAADYLKIRNCEKPEISFEGLYVQKRRSSAKAERKFKISESSSPYTKHQISQHGHDYIIPDRTWYPTVERHREFKDVGNQSAWPSFVTEDARESLSLLSEESCSSSAVWCEASKNQPHNTLGRQDIRDDADCMSPVNMFSVKKNTYAQEHRKYCDNLQQQESIIGPGMCTRMSNRSSSRAAHYSSTTLSEKSGREDWWLFGEGYTTRNVKPDINSFCRTSGTQKGAPSGCKLWPEEPFSTYSVPKLHVDAKLSPERSKYDVSAESSCPHGSFFSEELTFCQQLSPVHSYKTPNFPNNSSGSNKLNLFPDSGLYREERDYLNIPVQESVSAEGEKESITLPANSGKLELQEDVCDPNNGVSSENGTPMDALDSQDNCSHCEEPKGGTPDLTDGLNAPFSPERSEEASTSMEIPHKLEDGYAIKEC